MSQELQIDSTGPRGDLNMAACTPMAYRSHFQIQRAIAAFFALFCATFSFGCGSIPSDVDDVIFKKSTFAQPIGINPGPEDGASAIADAKQHTTDNGLLSRVVITNYLNADRKLLSFLVKHGYSTVECLPVMHRYGTDSYCYIAHINAQDRLRMVANRKLTKITYSNKYKSAILGTSATVYAVTFQYNVDVLLKDFPSPKGTFEGSAQALLNPNTGKWELINMKLSDSGDRYFVNYIHSHYEPYTPALNSPAATRGKVPDASSAGTAGALASTPKGWSPVENALKRRLDLVPGLLTAVQSHRDITPVADALVAVRAADAVTKQLNAALSSVTIPQKIEANCRLENALREMLRVLGRTEPTLASNDEFLRIRDELAGVENRIAVERRQYNEDVGIMAPQAPQYFKCASK